MPFIVSSTTGRRRELLVLPRLASRRPAGRLVTLTSRSNFNRREEIAFLVGSIKVLTILFPEAFQEVAKSSKLVAEKRGRVLLVRRRRDRLWMFPGGRKRGREKEKDCLKREIKEELPKLKLGPLRFWKQVKAKNPRSGRKMSDAIFIARKATGRLSIGDKREIDRASWRKPRGIRLTPTSRYIRDKLFPK